MDSAAQVTTASPVTVGDVDYFYTGKVRTQVKALLEEGERVPVWIQGDDFWGEVNGQGFIIRSTDEIGRPRMVPVGLAECFNNSRKAEQDAAKALKALIKSMQPQTMADIPTYVR